MKLQRLCKGDAIGIVSPARWMEEGGLRRAASVLEQMGFRVKISPQNFLRRDQFAGSDEERARAIEEMFEDPEVKAVVCARGGYGALRIIDILNYDLLARNPKIFIGYSDITALLISIHKMTGLVTFHGPMLYSFVDEVDPFTTSYLNHSLCHPEPYRVEFSGDSPVRVLRHGIAEGELIGGNLSILIHLICTPHDFDTSGKILFLEDVDEYLCHLDRMFLHLKRSGKLDQIRGLIVGEMVDIHDDDIPFGKDVDGIIFDLLRDAPFPIVTNFPCGHGRSQLTIPISVRAKLVCSARDIHLTLLESPVL